MVILNFIDDKKKKAFVILYVQMFQNGPAYLLLADIYDEN